MAVLKVALLLILLTVTTNKALSGQHSEEQCLATAIYYEANTEPLKGKRAVYDVIRNRAEEAKKSICRIIKERGQFSWYGKKPMKIYDTQMENMLTQVNEHPKILKVEKFFFRKELKPKWARGMTCTVIGNHKFCKERYDEA